MTTSMVKLFQVCLPIVTLLARTRLEGLSILSLYLISTKIIKNGIKLAGYTFRLKNYVKISPPPTFPIFQSWRRNCVIPAFLVPFSGYYHLPLLLHFTPQRISKFPVKPILSDKGRSNSKITLIENDTIISNDKEVAETLNDYFVSITDSLDLTENSEVIPSTEGVSDPIDRAIIKYSNHPSIRKIRSFAQNDNFFKFQKVSLEQMHTEIGRLDPKKATTFKNIPARVLKSSSEICSESLQLIFNVVYKMVCFQTY